MSNNCLLKGQDVGKCPFKTRALCIDEELIGPRNKKFKEGKLDKTIEPFSVRKKDFWKISTVKMLIDEK